MSVVVDDETSHLIISADGVGVRVVLSLGHADGVDLYRQLTEYYGALEMQAPENVNAEHLPKAGLVARLLKRFNRG